MLYLVSLPLNHISNVTPKGTINKQIRQWIVQCWGKKKLKKKKKLNLHHYVSLKREKTIMAIFVLTLKTPQDPQDSWLQKYTKLVKWSCGFDMVTSWSSAINVSTTLQWRREWSQQAIKMSLIAMPYWAVSLPLVVCWSWWQRRDQGGHCWLRHSHSHP